MTLQMIDMISERSLQLQSPLRRRIFAATTTVKEEDKQNSKYIKGKLDLIKQKKLGV